MTNKNPIKVTELALCSANQHLLASRLRIDDILPLAEKLDGVGYWAMETCNQSIFESCIRYIGEDPWDRLRELKRVMPKTKQKMSLQGQSLLGAGNFGATFIQHFIERSVSTGIEVFDFFDAINEIDNLKVAIDIAKKLGAHVQVSLMYDDNSPSAISDYTALAKKAQDMGVNTIAIKDDAGLLGPYKAFGLIEALKKQVDTDVALSSNASSGLSSMAIVKAVDAGVDHIETAISSMSLFNSFSPTESIADALSSDDRSPALNLDLLNAVANDFSAIRKKYSSFDSAQTSVGSNVLQSRLSPSVLNSISEKLEDQNALNRFADAVAEVKSVQKDLGSIPLVGENINTIVSQAILNTFSGERYKSISKEIEAILTEKANAIPGSFNEVLQQRVSADKSSTASAIAEFDMDSALSDLKKIANAKDFSLADNEIDDVLIASLSPEFGTNFIENRNNLSVFEAPPSAHASAEALNTYSVELNNEQYTVNVGVDDNGHMKVNLDGRSHNVNVKSIAGANTGSVNTSTEVQALGESISSPLAGSIVKVCVRPGQAVAEGDVLLILEAMKMETEIKASVDATVVSIEVQSGDSVSVGDILINF